jgi:hypothetical protein
VGGAIKADVGNRNHSLLVCPHLLFLSLEGGSPSPACARERAREKEIILSTMARDEDYSSASDEEEQQRAEAGEGNVAAVESSSSPPPSSSSSPPSSSSSLRKKKAASPAPAPPLRRKSSSSRIAAAEESSLPVVGLRESACEIRSSWQPSASSSPSLISISSEISSSPSPLSILSIPPQNLTSNRPRSAQRQRQPRLFLPRCSLCVRTASRLLLLRESGERRERGRHRRRCLRRPRRQSPRRNLRYTGASAPNRLPGAGPGEPH